MPTWKETKLNKKQKLGIALSATLFIGASTIYGAMTYETSPVTGGMIGWTLSTFATLIFGFSISSLREEIELNKLEQQGKIK